MHKKCTGPKVYGNNKPDTQSIEYKIVYVSKVRRVLIYYMYVEKRTFKVTSCANTQVIMCNPHKMNSSNKNYSKK